MLLVCHHEKTPRRFCPAGVLFISDDIRAFDVAHQYSPTGTLQHMHFTTTNARGLRSSREQVYLRRLSMKAASFILNIISMMNDGDTTMTPAMDPATEPVETTEETTEEAAAPAEEAAT